jgi:hypothetical protein
MVWLAQASQQSAQCSTEAVASDQQPTRGEFNCLKEAILNISQRVSKTRMYSSTGPPLRLDEINIVEKVSGVIGIRTSERNNSKFLYRIWIVMDSQ